MKFFRGKEFLCIYCEGSKLRIHDEYLGYYHSEDYMNEVGRSQPMKLKVRNYKFE